MPEHELPNPMDAELAKLVRRRRIQNIGMPIALACVVTSPFWLLMPLGLFSPISLFFLSIAGLSWGVVYIMLSATPCPRCQQPFFRNAKGHSAHTWRWELRCPHCGYPDAPDGPHVDGRL